MSTHKPIDVSGIDENHLLYGNFIGVQYVFDRPLEVEILDTAIAHLVKGFPALAMRYDGASHNIRPSHHAITLKRQTQAAPLKDCLKGNARPRFISEPARKDVLRGKAPLSTFTLTEFACGGAVLGVAFSHVLMDAAGFHKVMKHLSHIYNALYGSPLKPDEKIPSFPFVTQLEAFEFGTNRSKAECLRALKERGLPKPIPIKGFLGKMVKSLIIKAMDKSIRENKAVRIRFSSGDVVRLKQAVLSESGEDWISTNIALCAHFTRIIAELNFGSDLKTEMQIAQLLDLRNRYFESEETQQRDFVGNAILIHIDKAVFPDGLQNTNRGDIARYFKHRQSNTDSLDVKTRLDLLSDCLRHGYTNPELDVKKPMISFNNQSKMPIYDLAFGGQSPNDIFPQDVGDVIMFFPNAAGGVDVHIRDIVNFGNQEKLLTPEWQKKIFDF